jgi:acyl carrier protein/seryl-tRNA synthetase
MSWFSYPKKFSNKLQTSYFQETLERSFLFAKLIAHPDGIEYEITNKRFFQEAESLLEETFKLAVNISVHVIFDKKQKIKFHENIFKTLLERGDANEIGNGIYVFQGQFLKLLNFFDNIFKKFAIDLDGIEQLYPTRWPIELFKKINYFEEFPQNILLVYGAKKDRNSLKFLTKNYSKDKKFKKIEYGEFLEPSITALGTSTCDPCYYIHRNANYNLNQTFFAINKCFRNEVSSINELDRLTEFSMREIIAVGQQEYVKEQREKFINFIDSFSDFCDLSCSLEKASDPFFTSDIIQKGALQNHIESKYEFLAEIGTTRPELAVGSVNWHSDFFGRSFEIHDNSKSYVNSCCLAFGLERLVYAFLIQYGTNQNNWPIKVKDAFNNFNSLGDFNFQNLNTERKSYALNKEKEFCNIATFSKYRQQVRKCILESLNISDSNEEWLSSKNTFNWDSLNHIRLINDLEKSFSISFPREKISNLMNEQSIVSFIDNNKN